MQKNKSKSVYVFSAIGIIAVLQIAFGYFWLESANTRDFNFGPPLLIMSGVIELMVGVAGILYSIRVNNRK